MPTASRHTKPKTPAKRLGIPLVAAATLAGVAAAFVSLQAGAAAPKPSRYAIPVTSKGPELSRSRVTTAVRRDIATLEARIVLRARKAAHRKHVAALAAARLARKRAAQAAQQQAAQQQAQQAAAQPSASSAPAPSSGGGDAASSPLGVCIRNAEEGGSYAWGPGNGGGAYQFQLGTWEAYGGAASEYGVAGPAYQDQIFDNAIAAGGASNWTNYDGC
jgi:hypothetical protein